MKKLLIPFLLIVCFELIAQNMPIRLPAIISNHEVLQQSSEVVLWGWGPSTLEVNIVCSWSPNDTIKALVKNGCA